MLQVMALIREVSDSSATLEKEAKQADEDLAAGFLLLDLHLSCHHNKETIVIVSHCVADRLQTRGCIKLVISFTHTPIITTILYFISSWASIYTLL